MREASGTQPTGATVGVETVHTFDGGPMPSGVRVSSTGRRDRLWMLKTGI